MIFTYFHFAAAEELTRAVIDSRRRSRVAYETVQLPSGELPLLTPMCEVAGRMAVQEGAKYLEKVFGGSGILLGGVPGVAPGEVVIIGGGVVGINAAKMAAGLGAHVTILDISLDRLRYLTTCCRPTWIRSTPTGTTSWTRSAGRTWWSGRCCSPAPRRPTWCKRADLKLMKPGLRHRGRRGRPGRLRRDHQTHHPREPHLLRRRHSALRRGKYAGRGAPNLHPRPHQCYAAIRT